MSRLIFVVNLGSMAKARGDLDRARELWTNARDIYARVGMPHMVKKVQEWLDGLPKSAAKAKRVTGGARSKGAAKGRKKAIAKAKGTRKKKKKKKKKKA